MKQGTRSVEEYYKEIEKAMIRANIHEAEEQTMARFMSGLSNPIKRITEFQPYNNVVELVHQAVKAERQVQQDSKNTRSYPTFTPRATTYSNKSTSRGTPEKSYTQGSGGGASSLRPPTTTTGTKEASTPITRRIPATSGSSSVGSTAKSREIQCFKCLGRGHIARECPNNRTMIGTEEGGYESTSDGEAEP